MKVANLYKEGKRPIYSLEVSPPRNGELLSAVYNVMESLLPFKPYFVSVTSGALGSARGGTIAIAASIRKKYNLESVVHFSCAGKSKQDVENLLIEMKYSGIQNVLALRGDPPKGQREFIPHEGGHKYASELVEQIKLLNQGKYLTAKEGKYYEGEPLDFGIGVAGYPECHPECPNKKKDLEYLKMKVDRGADYIITQMFLDADLYFKFVEEAQKTRINAPIVPGIMPIERYSQLKFILSQLKIAIPKNLEQKLDSHKDDREYIQKTCEEHTLSMAKKIIENGAPGIQFFTMNSPEGTRKILQELTRE